MNVFFECEIERGHGIDGEREFKRKIRSEADERVVIASDCDVTGEMVGNVLEWIDEDAMGDTFHWNSAGNHETDEVVDAIVSAEVKEIECEDVDVGETHLERRQIFIWIHCECRRGL